MRFFAPRLPLALCAAMALAGGCALWKSDKESDPSSLPPARMSADAVTLEFALVEIAHDGAEMGESFWALVDEQHLPLEARRRLADNGFRCGLLGAQLPPVLRKHLASLGSESDVKPLDLTSEGTEVDLESPCSLSIKQLRSGRRTRVLAGPVHNELAALVREAEAVRGESYTQAQCVISATPFLEVDGRVRVELVPEIEHGEPKQNWVAGEGNFILQTGKERVIFDALRLAGHLSPGQTLLVTCDWPPRGLGANFFSSSDRGAERQTFLLVRLAQTQLDDVFVGEQLREPLVTPLD